MKVTILIGLLGLWSVLDAAPPQQDLTEVRDPKLLYEILSSSHSQETTSNGTHTVTVYKTMKKTDTHGATTSQKETVYVVNNNGVITTYTYRDPK